MLIVNDETFTLGTTTRLVKKDDVAVIKDVTQVLEDAHRQADAIVQKAQDAFEEQRKLGFQKGVQDGKEDMAFQKLGLVEQSVEYLEKMENRVVDIVLAALHKCVDEIGDRELMVQIILNAMRAIVRNQQQITLKVAPQMIPEVKQRLEEIRAKFPSVNYINLVEAPSLDKLACILETDAGNVDASLSTQLAAIERALKKCFAKK